MERIEQQFAAEVDAAIEICKRQHNYNPTGIQGMIQRRQAKGEGAASTAVDLIHGGDVQSGFTRMWEISRQSGCKQVYKLTLEWLVTQPKYEELFEPETIALAKKRLREYFGVE